MNQSTQLMKIQHARTGLKLEKRLYLRAQSHAATLNHSFAAYVIDLIAADLAGLPETENIPDVNRIIRAQRPAAAELHANPKKPRSAKYSFFPTKDGQATEAIDPRERRLK